MADLRDYLPLKPVDLQVLLALAEKELHGYGIVQSMTYETEGIVAPEPGNLYRVIKRLIDDGLIAESTRRALSETDDERRRYYRITTLGGRVLSAELSRLQAIVSTPSVKALIRRWAL